MRYKHAALWGFRGCLNLPRTPLVASMDVGKTKATGAGLVFNRVNAVNIFDLYNRKQPVKLGVPGEGDPLVTKKISQKRTYT